MNRQSKWRIALLIFALLLPFVISAIQVLSPDSMAPIYKLFLEERKEATEATAVDYLFFLSFSIVPGLLCLLFAERSLVKRIGWGGSLYINNASFVVRLGVNHWIEAFRLYLGFE